MVLKVEIDIQIATLAARFRGTGVPHLQKEFVIPLLQGTE
jgi:hypothetical protein